MKSGTIPFPWDRLSPGGTYGDHSREVIFNTTRNIEHDAMSLFRACQEPHFNEEEVLKRAKELHRASTVRAYWVAWFAVHHPQHMEEILSILKDHRTWKARDWDPKKEEE